MRYKSKLEIEPFREGLILPPHKEKLSSSDWCGAGMVSTERGAKTDKEMFSDAFR